MLSGIWSVQEGVSKQINPYFSQRLHLPCVCSLFFRTLSATHKYKYRQSGIPKALQWNQLYDTA